mmetsp:Transcript_14370/g.36265  ORF Transcript_14370/g.36265 Transcript_14370/m.36265 type:complete len:251 (+) Transcript_14370:818-1570(+)
MEADAVERAVDGNHCRADRDSERAPGPHYWVLEGEQRGHRHIRRHVHIFPHHYSLVPSQPGLQQVVGGAHSVGRDDQRLQGPEPQVADACLQPQPGGEALPVGDDQRGLAAKPLAGQEGPRPAERFEARDRGGVARGLPPDREVEPPGADVLLEAREAAGGVARAQRHLPADAHAPERAHSKVQQPHGCHGENSALPHAHWVHVHDPHHHHLLDDDIAFQSDAGLRLREHSHRHHHHVVHLRTGGDGGGA